MRKPIVIDREKAGPLWKHVCKRAAYLDVVASVAASPAGLVGTQGVIRLIVSDVLAGAAEAERELGFAPEPAEAAGRDYLASLLPGAD